MADFDEILKQAVEMDYALAGPGVRLSEFAERWGVDEKTIRRRLDVFRFVLNKRIGQDHLWAWRYVEGERVVFFKNYVWNPRDPSGVDCENCAIKRDWEYKQEQELRRLFGEDDRGSGGEGEPAGPSTP